MSCNSTIWPKHGPSRHRRRSHFPDHSRSEFNLGDTPPGCPQGRTFPEPEGGLRGPKPVCHCLVVPRIPGSTFDSSLWFVRWFPPYGSYRSPGALRLPTPAPYEGDPGACHGFLLQVGGVFQQQPLTNATETSRIAYLIACLRGVALTWASAEMDRGGSEASNYLAFTKAMRRTFDHPVRGREAAQRLLDLRQGATAWRSLWSISGSRRQRVVGARTY